MLLRQGRRAGRNRGEALSNRVRASPQGATPRRSRCRIPEEERRPQTRRKRRPRHPPWELPPVPAPAAAPAADVARSDEELARSLAAGAAIEAINNDNPLAKRRHINNARLGPVTPLAKKANSIVNNVRTIALAITAGVVVVVTIPPNWGRNIPFLTPTSRQVRLSYV